MCDNGYYRKIIDELTDVCEPCPYGTYSEIAYHRNNTFEETCIPCPEGLSTANQASLTHLDCG